MCVWGGGGGGGGVRGWSTADSTVTRNYMVSVYGLKMSNCNLFIIKRVCAFLAKELEFRCFVVHRQGTILLLDYSIKNNAHFDNSQGA